MLCPSLISKHDNTSKGTNKQFNSKQTNPKNINDLFYSDEDFFL